MTFRPITHWNYRIIEHEEDEERVFTMHEVYYDDEGPHSWTAKPVTPTAGSRDEMILVLQGMLQDAKTKPVLRIENETGLVEIPG
jgi:hypothetical protein